MHWVICPLRVTSQSRSALLRSASTLFFNVFQKLRNVFRGKRLNPQLHRKNTDRDTLCRTKALTQAAVDPNAQTQAGSPRYNLLFEQFENFVAAGASAARQRIFVRAFVDADIKLKVTALRDVLHGFGGSEFLPNSPSSNFLHLYFKSFTVPLRDDFAFFISRCACKRRVLGEPERLIGNLYSEN